MTFAIFSFNSKKDYLKLDLNDYHLNRAKEEYREEFDSVAKVESNYKTKAYDNTKIEAESNDKAKAEDNTRDKTVTKT